MAETENQFISPGWVAKTKLRLVNGVWISVPDGTPPSSSAQAGKQRKPTSLREKLEQEARAKAAHAGAKAGHGHEAAAETPGGAG